MKKGQIVVLSGPLEGKRLVIAQSLTVGRGSQNDLQLVDNQISRKHIVIESTPGGHRLRDLGSGNGTMVEGGQVQEHTLSNLDIIRLGGVELRFEETDPDRTPLAVTGTVADTGGVKFVEKEAAKLEAASPKNVFDAFMDASSPDLEGEAVAPIQQLQERLSAVYKANQIISSERDLKKLFASVLDEIFRLVPASNGAILLYNPKTDQLQTRFTKSRKEHEQITISSTIVRRAFDRGEAIISFDAADDERFDASASILMQNITAAMCTPLQHQGENLGVLYVDARGATNAFNQYDLELLVALAGPSAIAIRNARFVEQIEKSYQDTLLLLANAIELRDHYTIGHTWRVTNFARAIAKQLGWDKEKLEECEMGGLLHDIGKIAVDDAVLRKDGPLTDEEFEKIKVHPRRGARMLQDVEALHPLIPYGLYHHERWDGKGYPFGLEGEDIPIEGRVICVADALDAMTSNRPYRKGMDPEIAVKRLIESKGIQFDPACVNALVKCYRDGQINRILQNYCDQEEKSIACPFCSTYTTLEDDAEEGDVYDCEVCRRKIKLIQKNKAFIGEVLPET